MISDILSSGDRTASLLKASPEGEGFQPSPSETLTPDNVMLDAAGQVKVLDFGLAQPRTEAGAQPRTGSTRLSANIHHLAPEQAEGKAADPRSDVFALGILLYQLATGRHPFPGDAQAEVVTAIMNTAHLPPTQARPALPPALDGILARCLAKDPAARYSDANGLRDDLSQLKQQVQTGEAVTTRRRTSRRSRNWGPLFGIAAGVALLGVMGYLMTRSRPGRERAPSLLDGRFHQVTTRLGLEIHPSLSPAGDFIVYAGNATGRWDVYLQRVGGERAINLTESSGGDDTQPSFSPDGERIAFRSERDGGGIFVMGATGEGARRIADFGFYPSWSPDGAEIAVSTQNVPDPRLRSGRSEIWLLNVGTGTARKLMEGDGVQPAWSPNGYRIAYWALARGGHRDLRTRPADGSDATSVTQDAALDWSPAWSPEGDYLFFSSNRGGAMNLWRVAINEKTGDVLGEPEPVTGGVSGAAQHASVSGSGKQLVYASVVVTQNLWKFGFDPERAAVTSEPTSVTRGSQPLYHPQVSPDGEWVVVASDNEDLFVVKSDGSEMRRLTDDDFQNREARWAPNGEHIAFQSDRSGTYDIWSIRRDGSGLRQLTETPDLTLIAPVWSPTGDRMACWNPRGNSVLLFDPNVPWGEQEPEEVLRDDSPENFFPWSWSPDGEWLAGDLVQESGAFEGITIYSTTSRAIETITDFGGPPF